MRTKLITTIAAALLMVSYAAAQNVSPSELQFREALHKQQVQGDLNGAITLYQNIAASKTAERTVKAKALLQLAACYEKLGGQSEPVYQRIVREFADQPAAREAKMKLDALRPAAPPVMTLRKVEFGEGIQNVVATDGQRVVYWDSNQTTLYFSDTKSKDKRVVFEASGIVPDVFPSRDLTMAFLFFPPDGPTTEPRYALLKTDGTGYRELTLTLNGKIVQFARLSLSWSWDNRYLTMFTPSGIRRASNLYKVSVADGRMLDLGKRSGNADPAQFSPDDRFIAYTASAAVYVVSAQGGEPRLIAPRATLGDWTRDGRYLIVEETPSAGPVNTSRSRKIWAVPVQNGQAAGQRVSIASDLGLPETHPNGTMIVRAGGRVEGSQIFHGILDSENHLSPWKTLNLNDAGRHPNWSPDGRQIVYIAGLDSAAVRIRNLISGADREVYRSIERIGNCLWARTQPRLFCGHISDGTEPRFEILSIALDSGHAEKIASFGNGFFRFLLHVSPDDRTLVTGTSREIAREWQIGTNPAGEKPIPRYLSEDGRWAARFEAPDGRRLIVIRPASADNDDPGIRIQTRMRVAAYGGGNLPIEFTTDSKWLVYQDKDDRGKSGLYRVSVSGGTPERLGDFPTDRDWSGFAVSPDGRQFLVDVQILPVPAEFWAIENVIPATKAPAK